MFLKGFHSNDWKFSPNPSPFKIRDSDFSNVGNKPESDLPRSIMSRPGY